ncbi:MT-A70 family methyltransferase [Pleomorphomonas sp. JP5]|uniref:MT-A70 family methyltransferase n=1 Tax=Pleomorphomonas sp. JP5 TaxID=2942998 RepID=UPI002043BEB7|nr:MT-A70 family methyltransferase [Pleomorphomonas sp. JP5]MCM5556302.1 MT-A70 family methyltransferase [Pleomorphomonas sp. JP5]
MLKPHPFADIFPMLDAADSDALRADIAAHGLREKVVLLHDEILDGRNRYRGLVEIAKLGLSYKGEPFTVADLEQGEFFTWFVGTEAEALEFVLSKNLHRRHLNESQRAMVAANLAGLRPGRQEADKPANLRNYRQAEAAERLHVSERSVQDARVVREKGIDDINAAVQSGDLAVSAAAQLARLPVDEQVRLMREHADPKALSKVAKDLRADKQREKAERRTEREHALGGKQRALPDKKYGVILTDFEWKYVVYGEATGRDRSPDNHYPCSDMEALRARDVGALAADDCMYFGWVPAPFLKLAIELMEHHGFQYVTHLIWIKERPGDARGTAYWFSGEHEVVLVGKRGNPPAPTPGTQFPSYFVAPVGEHSAKPDRVHEIAEAYFPNLPKIELNARRRRPGWDAWGNEADGGDVALETPYQDVTPKVVALAAPPIDREAGLLRDRGDSPPADHRGEGVPVSGVDPGSSAGASGDTVPSTRRVRLAKASSAPCCAEKVGNPARSSVAIEAASPDARLVAVIGDAVAFALNVGATLQMGDSRFHSPDERLIRRHAIRIAVDDFKISCPRLAAVLGGTKQAAAQLRLAAIGEVQADAELAAQLAEVAEKVAGRARS